MRRSVMGRYGLAVLASTLALLMTGMLGSVSDRNIFIIFLTAVAGSAWFGGVGPGALAAVLSGLAGAYFFIPPQQSFRIGAEGVQRVLIFFGASALIIALAEASNRARQAATEHREWLRVTLESIADAVLAADAQGRVTFMNQAAETLTGWTRDASEGRPLEQVLRITEQRRAERVAASGLPDGAQASHSEDAMLITKNGREVPIEHRTSPLRDRTGNGIGTVIVFWDVSERKRAEETRLHLAAIVESSDDAIVGKRLDGIIVSWNPAAERLYGYSAEEVKGKPVSMLVPPGRPDEIPSIMEKLRRGEHVQSYESVRRRKDGADIDVGITISPIRNDAGQIIGASAVARDITEHKRREQERARLLAGEFAARVEAETARERLGNLLREKEVLLREVHHRVKNNLQIISSLLNLQAGFIKDEDARQLYRESQNRVRSMALLHGILYQSRNLAEIDFAQYLQRLVGNLLHAYGEMQRSVHMQVEAEPIQFGMDTAIPCGLIVNELVSNALKHAFPDGRQGEVRIGLHANEDASYTLSVRDNGVGFPEHLDFRNAESLGLQLVGALCDQLGATANLNRNGGTCFEVCFHKLEYKQRL